MLDMVTVSRAELANLEDRIRKLAADKSHLQLIIQLMNRLSVVPGLDSTIESILRSVGEVIGGVDLMLYYSVGDEMHYADVNGARRRVDSIADGLVRQVFETHAPIEHEHAFSDTMMTTPEFTKAYTWVVPLLAGPDLVGVLKVESLHVAMRELGQQLSTYFAYAALVLKNEVLGHTRLKKAYDDLTREMAVRTRAEEALRLANEALEVRVASRTEELQEANERLRGSERQTALLLEESERSRAALAEALEGQRRVEASLQRERALLSSIVGTSPVCIVVVDSDGRVTFANALAKEVLGLTKEEDAEPSRNSLWSRITDGEGRPVSDDDLPFRRAVATARPIFGARHAITRPDGRRIFLSMNCAPLLTESGRAESVVLALEDITERKRADDALREQYSTLRSIMDSTNAFAFSVDRHHRYTSFNAEHAAVMKAIYGAQIALGSSMLEYMSVSEDRETARRNLDRALAGERFAEEAYSGDESLSRQYFRVSHSPIKLETGEIIGVAVLAQDMTERKRAEEALRRLNRELQALSSCNQILLRAVDEQALLSEVCRTVCDEAGYRLAWVGYAEHDVGKTIRPVAWAGYDSGYVAEARLTWAADAERGRGPAGVAIRSGEIINVQDVATDPRMGPWREGALRRGYRSGIAMPLTDESADVFGVLMVYSAETNAMTPDEIRLMRELAGDLAYGIVALRARTERKRVQDDLQKTNDLLRTIIEAAPTAIIGLDLDGRVQTVWNPAAEKMLGWTAQEVVGRLLPTEKEEELRQFREWSRAGTTLNGVELQRRRRDGTPIDCAVYASRLHGPAGQIIGAIVVLVDTTGRKLLERELLEKQWQLIHAEKMASLGMLVASVAHEVNSPNHAIMLNASLLQDIWRDMVPILREYRGGSGEFVAGGLSGEQLERELPHCIEALSAASRHIDSIVGGLKSFAQAEGDPQMGQVDLNSVLMAAQTLTANLLAKSTRSLSVRLQEPLPSVRGDFVRLEQVLINLIQNACEALGSPEGAIALWTSFDPQRGMVSACVRDEGVGMSEEDLAKVKTPFFTKKRERGGLGLGVSISNSIMELHDGSLWYESQPGKGTTATICLPAASAVRER